MFNIAFFVMHEDSEHNGMQANYAGLKNNMACLKKDIKSLLCNR